MAQYDLDRTAFKNETARPFFQPSKEASVGRLSYAQKWKDGSLQGICQPFKDNQYSFDWIGDVPEGSVSDTVSIQSTTWFDTDSAVLKKAGELALQKVLDKLEEYEEIHALLVTGHTDSIASEDYNLELGERRAQSVYEWLKPQLGQYPVEILSKGESEPVADNNTENGRTENRRVEIEIVGTPFEEVKSRLVSCYYSSESNIPPEKRARKRQLSQKNADRMMRRLLDVPLSRGDLLKLVIPESTEFSGVYSIGLDGNINIPLAGAIYANGRSISHVKEDIDSLMLDKQLLRKDLLATQLSVIKMASASVYVNGAVFAPGRVTLNKKASEKEGELDLNLVGDFSRERMLSFALFAAGGVRPDADLQNIVLKRNGEEFVLDMSGMVDGDNAEDVILVENDYVIVPTKRYFQPELVRPTQITPPGIRILMSNLTQPAPSNSLSAISKDSSNVPYGTRLLVALVSANCVGGSVQTNAARRAVLISTNPATGGTEVVERSITQLVSDPDRDDINPYLMPNDGIACYDSGVTNFRDVLRVTQEFLKPISDIKNILE